MRLITDIDGCVLRPWTGVDKASLLANGNSRAVWRNLTERFPHPYTEADADRWFTLTGNPGRSVHLAIEVGGAAVGGIGATALEGVAERTARFGYWLGEDHWGRGLATAAGRALLAVLEQERRFARLEAPVFAWNPASMRVLEKLGFQREGLHRCSISKDGQLIDSVMYAYLVQPC